MIQLLWDNKAQTIDLQRDGGNIVDNELLDTAVLISLFTRRRARDDDKLPDSKGHREGWWADAFSEVDGDQIGSRLWLLSRSTPTRRTLNLAKAYCEEALQWLIDDGIAESVDVTVERYNQDTIAVAVEILKPTRPTTRWSGVWQAHLEAL